MEGGEIMNEIRDEPISYGEKMSLSYIYASFFAMLGLLLFMFFISLSGNNWLWFLIFIGLFGIVTYALWNQARMYPHYKEIGIFYMKGVGVLLSAVFILTSIFYYYGWILAVYILSILFIFIPLIIIHRVQKRYPILRETVYSEKGGMISGTSKTEKNDIKQKEKAGLVMEGAIFGATALILFTAIMSYYNANWSFFIITLAVLSIIFGFDAFSKQSIFRYYPMLDRNQKKHLFILIILLVLCFMVPLPFAEDIDQYSLWTLVLLVLFSSSYYSYIHLNKIGEIPK